MLERAGGGKRLFGMCLVTLNNPPGFSAPQAVGLGPAYPASKVPINTVPPIVNGQSFDQYNCFDPVNNRIILPAWAKWVNVFGKLAFPTQAAAAASGEIGAHLFRNGGATNEAHYHDRRHLDQSIAGTTGGFLSVAGTTGGYIPVQSVGEYWELLAYQTLQAAGITLYDLGVSKVDNFLFINFTS